MCLGGHTIYIIVTTLVSQKDRVPYWRSVALC